MSGSFDRRVRQRQKQRQRQSGEGTCALARACFATSPTTFTWSQDQGHASATQTLVSAALGVFRACCEDQTLRSEPAASLSRVSDCSARGGVRGKGA
eukprot:664259-Rhodomonas_salina.2